jgi:hypothetical protein
VEAGVVQGAGLRTVVYDDSAQHRPAPSVGVSGVGRCRVGSFADLPGTLKSFDTAGITGP